LRCTFGLPSGLKGVQPLQWCDHIATVKRPHMPHTSSNYYRHCAALCVAVAASAALVGCGSLDGASNRVATLVSPYKIDIVQGNFVSKEQAAALQNGMSRIQVRDILGTPLLTSLFHADRWDYVFTFKRQGREPQTRKVTVFFKGDVMERVEGDDLPTEAEFVASLDSGRRTGQVPVLEASEESLTKFGASARASASGGEGKGPGLAASAPEPKTLPPLPDKYPPLEPSGR
jgi:outer membrane protein assembly factor BamE